MTEKVPGLDLEQYSGGRHLPDKFYDYFYPEEDFEVIDDARQARIWGSDNGGLTVYTEAEWLELFRQQDLEKLASGIFWDTLVKEVNRTNFKLPEKRPVDILDLACGRCKEGRLLNSFFGSEEPFEFSDQVNLFGIDTDSESIESAQYANGEEFDVETAKRVPSKNMVFIAGDATRLEDYPEIPEQVDVVVIRHQQFVGGPDYLPGQAEEIWSQIISNGIKRLRPGGIAIITCYFQIESEPVKKLLEGFSGKIVVDEKNEFARDRDDEQSILDDQYILIFEKE